jgi:hypothetical protein
MAAAGRQHSAMMSSTGLALTEECLPSKNDHQDAEAFLQDTGPWLALRLDALLPARWLLASPVSGPVGGRLGRGERVGRHPVDHRRETHGTEDVDEGEGEVGVYRREEGRDVGVQRG